MRTQQTCAGIFNNLSEKCVRNVDTERRTKGHSYSGTGLVLLRVLLHNIQQECEPVYQSIQSGYSRDIVSVPISPVFSVTQLFYFVIFPYLF